MDISPLNWFSKQIWFHDIQKDQNRLKPPVHQHKENNVTCKVFPKKLRQRITSAATHSVFLWKLPGKAPASVWVFLESCETSSVLRETQERDVHKGNYTRSQGSTPSPSPFHGSHSSWSTGIKPSLLSLQICWENNSCLGGILQQRGWILLVNLGRDSSTSPPSQRNRCSLMGFYQILLWYCENTPSCCEVTVFFHIYLYLGASKEKLR